MLLSCLLGVDFGGTVPLVALWVPEDSASLKQMLM